MQVLSDHEFQSSVDDKLVLVGRWGKAPVQQLQFTLKTDAVKFATLLDPWQKDPQLKMTQAGGTVTLTVHSANFDDTWTWKEAKDTTTPSQIAGKRNGETLIALTEADKAPTK